MAELLNQNLYSKIKQPTPEVVKNSESNPLKKEIKRPNVGVVGIAPTSTTPLADTIHLREKENPQMRYKFNVKLPKFFNFQNSITLGIVFCAVISLFKLKKK